MGWFFKRKEFRGDRGQGRLTEEFYIDDSAGIETKEGLEVHFKQSRADTVRRTALFYALYSFYFDILKNNRKIVYNSK